MRPLAIPLCTIVVLVLSACAPSKPAGLDPEVAGRIDQLFERWNNRNSPGCAAGVARGGRMIYARGFGSANLDHHIANAPSTVFPIGSNSKQFTAMVVALLAEDGRLSLDDDVRRWVPELPAYARPITVRDLLHHTSGLRDYQALRFLSGTPPDYVDLGWVLHLLSRQRGTHFPAGEKWEYSNSNYVLARVVAERASGRTLRQLARERIFEPLGMRSTTWDETGRRIVHNRATPYTGGGLDGWRIALGTTLAGSGGIWTTIEDLLRWDENFYHNRLGKGDPGLVRRAVEPSRPSFEAVRPLEEDSRDGYGFGVFLGRHHGRPIQWHAGRGPGHVGDMARYPRQHVSVFCLCNATIDTRFLARKMADLVLGDENPKSLPVPVYTSLPQEIVAASAGDYLNPVTGTVWSLSGDPSAPGKIALDVAGADYILSPTGPGEVFFTDPPLGWRVTIERDEKGRGNRLNLFEEGVETAHYQRLGKPPAPATLAAYAGTYDCDELENPYTLEIVDGTLHLRTKVQPNGTLAFGGPDRFILPTEWFTLIFQFTRDARGRVTGFRLDSGGANGFRFERRRES